MATKLECSTDLASGKAVFTAAASRLQTDKVLSEVVSRGAFKRIRASMRYLNGSMCTLAAYVSVHNFFVAKSFCDGMSFNEAKQRCVSQRRSAIIRIIRDKSVRWNFYVFDCALGTQ